MSRYLTAVALAFVAACTSPTSVSVPDAAPAPQPQADADQVPGVPQAYPHLDAIAPTPDAAADLIPVLPMDAAQPRDIAAPDLIPVSPDTAPDVSPSPPDVPPDTAPPAPDTRPPAAPCTPFPTNNITPNPGFDRGPDGWTITGPGRWDGDRDVEMCDSGSVMLLPAAQLTTTTCLPLSGVGPGYQLTFELLGSTTLGSAGCGLRWDDGTEATDFTATGITWQHRQSVATAPAGATCVQVFCTVNQGSTWFDRVKLVNVH